MSEPVQAVVFDVGKVLIEWDLRLIYREAIPDPAERDWFVSHVVTPQWHFQHDAGRPLAEMVPERIAEFPEHEALIADPARSLTTCARNQSSRSGSSISLAKRCRMFQ